MPIRVFAQHKRAALHRRDCRQHRRRYHIVMKCVLDVKSRERSLSSSVCHVCVCASERVQRARDVVGPQENAELRQPVPAARTPTDRPTCHPSHSCVYAPPHTHTWSTLGMCVSAALVRLSRFRTPRIELRHRTVVQ